MVRIRKTNDRPFWVALACAALLHAVLIFGAGSANPRQMGEAQGQLDAISVDFVEPEVMAGDAAGPQGDAHAQDQSHGQDASTSALQVPRPATDAAAWQAETAPDKPAETASEKTKVEHTAPDKPKAPSIEEKPQRQAMFSQPDPETQKSEKESQKENQKATKTPATKDKASAHLDLSLPSSLFKAPAGGGDYSSAMVRPPGITRSGENDDFGRDVVKALRKTMPAHEKIYGRVTVRLLLSANGDLVDLQLVRGSGSSYLDQIVMFAVRQSVFPFPPKGSTSVDRTFMITYIYN